ncbi:[FeFe] hydrogenase H-cluster maturation GTPase HydF [Clostridium folliculivorans]|uniref:[FeFe] hydrogenase H-cluster maturation GTPase HydF n=1 Tax=Clostridium folliculivorans TaxID=2886038 RepID=A0A9W6DBI3_9CLOT|nr:[FeFe] hydrogenase H-cluster maturation GTPase HydF [Clostridium folliculivorans]GKU25743.1 [FeFe] hydrogenase H-cluster maturation GTPase HydF [Clostridium folliculivorans]
MSLNSTPRSERVHIALFGRRNAGKSSIINAITEQEISIVSEVKGTTTDPVYKAIEILPIGPCVIIDTAGLDDQGELGELRIKKTIEVLDKADVALIVVDGAVGVTGEDINIVKLIKEKNIPVLGVLNKIDQLVSYDEAAQEMAKKLSIQVVPASASLNKGIKEIKNKIISLLPQEEDRFKIVGDLINPGDLVVLVTPIDKAAPKGRLILPQQQTIRDILESDAIAVVTKEHELRQTLDSLGRKPKLVITDSQVFLKVSADTPKDIMLTSFSILFARYKGDLAEMVRGIRAIKKLKDGDKILVSEGCTHHKQADDIARVKIPRWLRQLTGKELSFEYSSGVVFTDDVKQYSLIVHCGGCMLNRTAMCSRIEDAKAYNVPIVNYGMLIAYVQGILERALEPFPMAKLEYEELD